VVVGVALEGVRGMQLLVIFAALVKDRSTLIEQSVTLIKHTE